MLEGAGEEAGGGWGEEERGVDADVCAGEVGVVVGVEGRGVEDEVALDDDAGGPAQECGAAQAGWRLGFVVVGVVDFPVAEADGGEEGEDPAETAIEFVRVGFFPVSRFFVGGVILVSYTDVDQRIVLGGFYFEGCRGRESLKVDTLIGSPAILEGNENGTPQRDIGGYDIDAATPDPGMDYARIDERKEDT